MFPRIEAKRAGTLCGQHRGATNRSTKVPKPQTAVELIEILGRGLRLLLQVTIRSMSPAMYQTNGVRSRPGYRRSFPPMASLVSLVTTGDWLAWGIDVSRAGTCIVTTGGMPVNQSYLDRRDVPRDAVSSLRGEPANHDNGGKRPSEFLFFSSFLSLDVESS